MAQGWDQEQGNTTKAFGLDSGEASSGAGDGRTRPEDRPTTPDEPETAAEGASSFGGNSFTTRGDFDTGSGPTPARDPADDDSLPFTPSDDIPPGDRPTDVQSADAWGTVESSGEFQAGQVIFNRYVVRKKLGAGGMGDVWLVTHRELNADRALKVIVSRISFDVQARARFRREAQVMASFHHPNAVTVHDARLTQQDVAYIDMEYVQGRALSDVLRRGEPKPLDWVARVLDQLCDVLEVAHQKGIVHRDLKPANLMLLDGREPGREFLKVLDFGIAKILAEGGDGTEAGGMTAAGAFLGTPFYASPEQADGEADTRADIYAVGVILYEFLTGYRPFSGPAARVLVEKMTSAPPPFSVTNPAASCPPAVEALVMRCLARTPDGRPQTAREVAELFRAALPGGGGLAPSPLPIKPPLIEPLGPALGRRALLAVAITAALGAGGFALYRYRDGASGGSARRDRIDGTKPGTPPTSTPEGPAREVVRDGRTYTLRDGGVYLPAGYSPEVPGDLVDGLWPRALVRDGDKMPFVYIRGGTFPMHGPDGEHRDRVAHDVRVPGFYIQKYEVTNRDVKRFAEQPGRMIDSAPIEGWRRRLDDMKAKIGDEALDHPATRLPWPAALEFARARGAYLPTEAQWECAARSGRGDRELLWDAALDQQKAVSRLANINNDGEHEFGTVPVEEAGGTADGLKDVTSEGVVGMIGNVREMCRPISGDAHRGEAAPASWFIARGGSYYTPVESKYTSYPGRVLDADKDAPPDVGFRLVLELPEPVAPPPG